MSSARFAAVVPVGPGEIELKRALDLLDALATYEPDVALVVIADDSEDASRWTAHLGTMPFEAVVVPNPRNGRGDGWSDGLAAGLFAGYRSALESDVDFIVKLDSDALVIAPFAKSLAAAFAGGERIGILGACRHTPLGAPRNVRHLARQLRGLTRPVRVRFDRRRRTFLINSSLTRRGRRIAAIIGAARRRGYVLGEHCMGGSYAVSAGALSALDDSGDLEPLGWLGTGLAEDVILAVSVSAHGYTLGDLAGRDLPFGVQWRSLPGDPPSLVEQGYSIIHPVKGTDAPTGWTEESIRQYFRDRRSAQGHRRLRG